MNIRLIKSLLLTVLCGFWAFSVNAATPMFSEYGQIQNVQFYSTNPFWTPNSPYNKRMPQPVYVQGADLNTEDCLNVVQSLVYVQCVARDNCRDTSLADIRPTIMVQLSKLPGNNYVSACAGYIDGVYDSFVKQYGNTVPNRAVNFPTATFPNPDVQNINTSPQNAVPTQTQQKVPDWQSAINERTQELIELQKQNGADSYNLSATDFPATIADLSFTARNELKTDGYKPFMNKSAYTTPIIKNQKEWCAEHADYSGCPQPETKKAKSIEKIVASKGDDEEDKDDGDSVFTTLTHEELEQAMEQATKMSEHFGLPASQHLPQEYQQAYEQTQKIQQLFGSMKKFTAIQFTNYDDACLQSIDLKKCSGSTDIPLTCVDAEGFIVSSNNFTDPVFYFINHTQKAIDKNLLANYDITNGFKKPRVIYFDEDMYKKIIETINTSNKCQSLSLEEQEILVPTD